MCIEFQEKNQKNFNHQIYNGDHTTYFQASNFNTASYFWSHRKCFLGSVIRLQAISQLDSAAALFLQPHSSSSNMQICFYESKEGLRSPWYLQHCFMALHSSSQQREMLRGVRVSKIPGKIAREFLFHFTMILSHPQAIHVSSCCFTLF